MLLSKLLKGFSPTFPISNQHLSAYVVAEITDIQSQKRGGVVYLLVLQSTVPPSRGLSHIFKKKVKVVYYFTIS